jgi:putative addiction module component (TIGR02574 family)
MWLFKQIIKNIGRLTSTEKAQIAHCLITSLEAKHDDAVDDAWSELAQQRFNELNSGSVEGVSWEQIKKKIKD